MTYKNIQLKDLPITVVNLEDDGKQKSAGIPGGFPVKGGGPAKLLVLSPSEDDPCEDVWDIVCRHEEMRWSKEPEEYGFGLIAFLTPQMGGHLWEVAIVEIITGESGLGHEVSLEYRPLLKGNVFFDGLRHAYWHPNDEDGNGYDHYLDPDKNIEAMELLRGLLSDLGTRHGLTDM